MDVKDGQVTLTGTLELRSEQETLIRLCRGVDGVVHVTVSGLKYRTDDAPAVMRAHVQAD